MDYLLMFLLASSALFLIVLVLIQRGKGGGLAGAFGGMGGQSAFGTKAGDLFTKVTIVVAIGWILLCVSSILILGGKPQGPLKSGLGGAAQSQQGLNAGVEPGPEDEPGPSDE